MEALKTGPHEYACFDYGKWKKDIIRGLVDDKYPKVLLIQIYQCMQPVWSIQIKKFPSTF